MSGTKVGAETDDDIKGVVRMAVYPRCLGTVNTLIPHNTTDANSSDHRGCCYFAGPLSSGGSAVAVCFDWPVCPA